MDPVRKACRYSLNTNVFKIYPYVPFQRSGKLVSNEKGDPVVCYRFRYGCAKTIENNF